MVGGTIGELAPTKFWGTKRDRICRNSESGNCTNGHRCTRTQAG